MIYIMSVVFAEILNFRHIISIKWLVSIVFCYFKPSISDLKSPFLHFGVNQHIFLIENG